MTLENQPNPSENTETTPVAYVTREDLDAVVSRLSEQITGAAGRMKKETTNEFQSSINGLIEALKGQKQANDQPVVSTHSVPPISSASETSSSKKDDSPVEALQAQLQELMNRQNQQTSLVEKQNQLIQQLQQENAQARQQAEAERVKNLWTKSAGDKVHSPDQLLTLALGGGDVVLQNGVPVVQTQEIQANGEFKVLSGDDAIASLLSKPEYTHFRKGNSGGGTGAVPVGNASTTQAPSVVDGIPLEESDAQRLARIEKEYGLR